MRWVSHTVDEDHAGLLARQLGVSRVVAGLLLQNEIETEADARAFLDPRLRTLTDPFALTNMDRAITRLRRAIHEDEDIIVFGDYDVDGVTSTTFLVSILQRFGLSPRYTVPLRQTEGYGLSREAINRAFEEHGVPGLLIAVDCGTNSTEEVRYLRDCGCDVIILDHHKGQPVPDDEAILINPHVNDGEAEPWRHLCTVGLVFKFVHALIKALREDGDQVAQQVDLKEFLDLVAMGTVADLVPLTGENRILTRAGLDLLRRTQRVGLCALYEVSGLTLGDTVSPMDISFRIGPRINASGRLDDAVQPIEMLLSEDWTQCRESARQLDAFNRERQDIERKISREAERMVEDRYADAPGLVLYHKDWHPGVVGIVASRIMRKFHRPCIILGDDGEAAKGSGRSIPGISLVEVLQPCTDLLGSWGGHPAAVGASLPRENLDAFREQFCASILENVAGQIPEPEIKISAWLQEDNLGSRLLQELDQLEPFGQGNPEPLFGIRNVVLSQPPQRFGKNHFRFALSNGRETIGGVAWNMADRVPDAGRPLDLAARLAWNVWNGNRSPQLTLIDWRESGSSRS